MSVSSKVRKWQLLGGALQAAIDEIEECVETNGVAVGNLVFGGPDNFEIIRDDSRGFEILPIENDFWRFYRLEG